MGLSRGRKIGAGKLAVRYRFFPFKLNVVNDELFFYHVDLENFEPFSFTYGP